MSELQTRYITDTYLEYFNTGKHALAQIYLKPEADAYIRRLKYKRCMAMAERCKFRMYYLSTVVDYEASKLRPNPTAVKRYSKKESRMDYWKNRWLELADQFKEGK